MCWDGCIALVGSLSGNLFVWDLFKAELLDTLPAHKGNYKNVWKHLFIRFIFIYFHFCNSSKNRKFPDFRVLKTIFFFFWLLSNLCKMKRFLMFINTFNVCHWLQSKLVIKFKYNPLHHLILSNVLNALVLLKFWNQIYEYFNSCEVLNVTKLF